jgi:hypothetical protein
VFGCGDEYSAGFALTDSVLKAGARPDEWKQRKPGYHYFYGVGIDDVLFPVPARTNSGASREELTDSIRSRAQEFAPKMAKLDRGSADATKDPGEPASRWDLLAKHTATVRKQLQGETATMTATDRNSGPHVRSGPAATFTADDARPGQDADTLVAGADFDADVRSVTEVEGVNLDPSFPDDPTAGMDLDAPLAPPDPDDDLTFEESKPAPASRQEAIRALHAALRELMDDPKLRDPADPSGDTAIVQVNDIFSRYQFKSRPWFSGELSRMADGATTPPPTLSLERHPDFPVGDGKYRLRRVGDDH